MLGRCASSHAPNPLHCFRWRRMNRPTTYRFQPSQSTLGTVLLLLELFHGARVSRTRLVVHLSAERFRRQNVLRVGIRVVFSVDIFDETVLQEHEIRLPRGITHCSYVVSYCSLRKCLVRYPTHYENLYPHRMPCSGRTFDWKL